MINSEQRVQISSVLKKTIHLTKEEKDHRVLKIGSSNILTMQLSKESLIRPKGKALGSNQRKKNLVSHN